MTISFNPFNSTINLYNKNLVKVLLDHKTLDQDSLIAKWEKKINNSDEFEVSSPAVARGLNSGNDCFVGGINQKNINKLLNNVNQATDLVINQLLINNVKANLQKRFKSTTKKSRFNKKLYKNLRFDLTRAKENFCIDKNLMHIDQTLIDQLSLINKKTLYAGNANNLIHEVKDSYKKRLKLLDIKQLLYDDFASTIKALDKNIVKRGKRQFIGKKKSKQLKNSSKSTIYTHTDQSVIRIAKVHALKSLEVHSNKQKCFVSLNAIYPAPADYIRDWNEDIVDSADLDGKLNDNFNAIFWKRKVLGHPDFLTSGPMVHKQLDIMGYYKNKYTGEEEIRVGLNHRVHSSMCAKYIMKKPFNENTIYIKRKYWERHKYLFQNTYNKKVYLKYTNYLTDVYKSINLLRSRYHSMHIIKPFQEIPLAGFKNNLSISLFIINKDDVLHYFAPTKFYLYYDHLRRWFNFYKSFNTSWKKANYGYDKFILSSVSNKINLFVNICDYAVSEKLNIIPTYNCVNNNLIFSRSSGDLANSSFKYLRVKRISKFLPYSILDNTCDHPYAILRNFLPGEDKLYYKYVYTNPFSMSSRFRSMHMVTQLGSGSIGWNKKFYRFLTKYSNRSISKHHHAFMKTSRIARIAIFKSKGKSRKWKFFPAKTFINKLFYSGKFNYLFSTHRSRNKKLIKRKSKNFNLRKGKKIMPRKYRNPLFFIRKIFNGLSSKRSQKKFVRLGKCLFKFKRVYLKGSRLNYMYKGTSTRIPELLHKSIFKKYNISFYDNCVKDSFFHNKQISNLASNINKNLVTFGVPVHMAAIKSLNRVKFYCKRIFKNIRLKHFKFGALGTSRVEYYKKWMRGRQKNKKVYVPLWSRVAINSKIKFSNLFYNRVWFFKKLKLSTLVKYLIKMITFFKRKVIIFGLVSFPSDVKNDSIHSILKVLHCVVLFVKNISVYKISHKNKKVRKDHSVLTSYNKRFVLLS